jgi:hypothetical protein
MSTPHAPFRVLHFLLLGGGRRQSGALNRRLLSFRTVAARSAFMQRESQDGGGTLDEHDPDMEAMARVWAYPEDLHLYPVSALCRSSKLYGVPNCMIVFSIVLIIVTQQHLMMAE